MPPDDSSPAPQGNAGVSSKLALAVMLLVFLVGAALRIYGPPAFKPSGHDEFLYMRFVEELNTASVFNYPEIVQLYNHNPEAIHEAKLPPTRFLYIFFGSRWDQLFYSSEKPGTLESEANALASLHDISCLFSILTMPLAAFFAFRLGGARMAAGVLALIAFSPMQIYVSRHALIDGFFAFWALLTLWLLWENLQRPRHPWLLMAYVVSWILLVLTKENAFFVFVGVSGVLFVNRWAKFGTVDRALVLSTFGGAVLGVAAMALLSGGLDYAIQTYMLLVHTASQLDYASQTGDGPWHRYLCELLIMAPFVLLLSVGALFRVKREDKAQLFLLCFVAFSYLVMCNVRYGMNLRYTNMWDMPLCFLAFWQLGLICNHLRRWGSLTLSVLTVLLCFLSLGQYKLFFVDNHIYEPVPRDVFRAVKIYVQ